MIKFHDPLKITKETLRLQAVSKLILACDTEEQFLILRVQLQGHATNIFLAEYSIEETKLSVAT